MIPVQSTLSQIKSEDLRKIVGQARSSFIVPAAVVVVMNSHRLLQTEIQGVTIHDKGNVVTNESYFHIGSCSKSILSVIAAKLIEENKINWDTKFITIYSELKGIALKEFHNITLEDLFLCKAGIKGFTAGDEKFPELDSNSINPRYDFAKWLVQQKPVAKIQNEKFEFHYSNAGYTMASLMLERVSGKSYQDLIKVYVENEMDIETFIGFPNRYDREQPWGHNVTKNGIEEFSPDHAYRVPELLIPAGDISMKPKGFAEYIRLSLKGLRGEDNFVKSDSYKYIHNAYAGFSIGVYNSKMFGYSYSGMDGSAGTFFCRAILIPESDFAFTIMTNSGSGTVEMKAVDWITLKIVKKYFNWWWKFWM